MLILLYLFLLLLPQTGFAATNNQKPVIAVIEFSQEVSTYYHGCKGYHWHHQDQLKTVLEAELAKAGMKVVERRNIRKIYEDEHRMENLDPATKSQAKKFKAAKFTVSGGI